MCTKCDDYFNDFIVKSARTLEGCMLPRQGCCSVLRIETLLHTIQEMINKLCFKFCFY